MGKPWVRKYFRHNDIPPPYSENCVILVTFGEKKGADLHLVSDISIHVERRQLSGSEHLFDNPYEKNECGQNS